MIWRLVKNILRSIKSLRKRNTLSRKVKNLPKKAKKDEKITTKTTILSQNSDVPQLSNNTTIAETNDLKKAVRGVPKESLITRLRNTSSHIEHSFALLHIPRHKNAGPNDSEDDEVSNITPEVRRQIRMKLETQMKLQPRAHNRAELQERLRLKLEELRGPDKSNSKGKITKKKLTKAEKKAKAKEEKKLKAKLARKEQKGNFQKTPGNAKPAKPVFNSDGKMVFSKFDFTNGECAIGGESAKKTALDPKAALGKIKKHKEKIQSLQAIGKTERAKSLEDKATWKSVMERTEGVKVKDDEGLLKKSIKKLDQKKKSSKRKWDARVEGEENRKKMQQQKRSGNIKKRKQDIKQSKLKKASKKGRSIPGFR